MSQVEHHYEGSAGPSRFRIVNGQRVWTHNPPNDFLLDVLTGDGCLTQGTEGQRNLQDVIRLLQESQDAAS